MTKPGIRNLQCVIFHVEKHPIFPWFTQCVTFNFFPTPAHELAYNLFNMVALYMAPLVVIVVAYSLILWEISKKSRESREQTSARLEGSTVTRTFRRSGMGRIEKARIRTLKMTIVIVLVFLACWTPYFVISAWWWIDKNSAKLVDAKIQRGLLIFAVSNSCVNPIVYGMFTNTFAREFKRCCWSKLMPKGDVISNTTTSSKRQALLAKRGDTKPNGRVPTQPVTRTVSASASVRSVEASRPNQPTSNVMVAPDQEVPVLTKLSIARQVTPPHIAQGKGHRYSFDNYLLI